MKNIFFCFFIAMLVFNSCKIVRYTEKIKKGESEIIKESGWYKMIHNDTLPWGVWREYNSDGVLMLKTKYEIYDGRWVCNGLVREYYYDSGKLWKSYHAKHGNIIGKETAYYPSGKKMWVLSYDNGKLPYGEATYFYDNGHTREHGKFGARAIECKLDSIKQTFILSDSIQTYYPSKVGVWKNYDISGNLISTGSYLQCIEMKTISPSYQQSDDSLFIETTPEETPEYIKDGIWKYWDGDGNFIKWEKFENGFLVATGHDLINIPSSETRLQFNN